MGIKSKFFNQFKKPTGNLGKFVGHLMYLKNRKRSRWTIEKLNVNSKNYVLEIGYGSGYTLNKIAGQLTEGFIAGVDHSEVMFKQAEKHIKKYIENKKAELHCGTVMDLPYPEKYFDIIFGSNVHFFWNEPLKEFSKLFSLLKDNGQLKMVYQPRSVKSDDELMISAENTKRLLEETGLKNVRIEYKPMKPVTCIYVSGQKLPIDKIS